MKVTHSKLKQEGKVWLQHVSLDTFDSLRLGLHPEQNQNSKVAALSHLLSPRTLTTAFTPR